MRIICWVLSLFMLACASHQREPVVPEAARVQLERAWREARARHPLYFQAVFAERAAGRYRSVVVTEPPPHATPEGIKRALGATSVETREFQVGYDGWTRDVLALVEHDPNRPPDETAELDADRLSALHEYLFHSTYRATVLDPFAPVPENARSTLDLNLPAGSLHLWLADPKRRFMSIEGAEIEGPDLMSPQARGTYRALDLGLSVCVLDPNQDLNQVPDLLREFALETDIFLGGLRTREKVLLVGRERRVPIDYLPPLRTETLLALASVSEPELAQSYQRLNLFAGKLKNGTDWAPIHHSPELVDTEFGGLLDVTDQLLKGWSLNGATSYHHFPYRTPKHWAAAEPLDRELGTSGLTFNWNTSGAIFAVEHAGMQAVLSPRTGALPIAYVPEGTAVVGIAPIEQRNRDFFARESDPNLVRTVGYTTFYHVAKLFGLRAGSSQPRLESTTSSRWRSPAEQHLEASMRAWLGGQKAPHLLPPTTAAQRQQFVELERAVDSVRQQLGEGGVDELVHYIAGVSSYRSVDRPHQEVIDFARKIAAQLGHTELRELVDRDAAFAEYARLARRQRNGFVGTPSVVLSSTADSVSQKLIDNRLYEVRTQYSGGHNLRLAPGVFNIEPGSPAKLEPYRPFRFEATVDERALLADSDALQRLQKEFQDGRIDAPTALPRLEEALANGIPLPELPPADPGDAGVGFERRRPPSGVEPPDAFVVTWRGREQHMYEVLTPNGEMFDGGSTAAVRRLLVLELRRRSRKMPRDGLFLEVRDFSNERAQRFVRNIADHLNADRSAPRVLFVVDRPKLAARVRAWLERGNRSTDARITDLGSAVVDGRTEHRYRVELERGSVRFLVRVREWMSKISGNVLERLQRLFGTSGNALDALDEFCRDLRVNIDVSVEQFAPRSEPPPPPGAPPHPEIPSEDQVELWFPPPAVARYAGATASHRAP